MFVTLQDKKAEDRTAGLLAALQQVWESSVKATHWFLSKQEFECIKRIVPLSLRGIPHLIVAENEAGSPVAFAGVGGHKLEMLFVSAENRGKGIGKRLLQYAVENYAVNKVSVNEQNPQAIGFYLHMGFRVYKKSERDAFDNPYPVLHMKRVL